MDNINDVRGYFAIGIEGVTKPYNAGNLFRTAHAFGASFVYTVGSDYGNLKMNRADTSKMSKEVPFYEFPTLDDFQAPQNATFVGIELLEDSITLPSFRHPHNAIYVLGAEKGTLSDEMLEKCTYTIKIPMKFCVNVGTAGAIVMYDRIRTMGKFAPRPVGMGGSKEELKPHVHGKVKMRNAQKFEKNPI